MESFDLNRPPEGLFVYRTECHYDDLDGQMLLHHPRYLNFVERAQQGWFEAVLEAPRFAWETFPDMYHVVRKVEIEFFASIDSVMPFAVVLWCARLRAAAMTTGFRIQALDGSRVFAAGSRTNCRIAIEDHRPLMWTDLFQDRMATWAAAAESLGLNRNVRR